MSFALVPVEKLKTHERAERERVRRVARQMRSTGMVTKAIVADEDSLVVLDGAHRLSAMKALGCVMAPVWLIDYDDVDVVVFSKGRKSEVAKEAVIRAAIEGPKLTPKSTRHMVRGKDGTLVHVSRLGMDVAVPLSALRDGTG